MGEWAVKQAQEQLDNLCKNAVKEVGESNASIFEVNQMMLEDGDYLDAIYNMIHQFCIYFGDCIQPEDIE